MVYSAMLGDYLNLVVAGAMLGACLGFLRHNWRPARIFMGDGGSLMLGFLLAGLSLHSATKAPAAVAILVPVLALGVPVQDTLLVMAVRFFGRPNSRTTERILRVFHADRKHLHHVMQNLNLNRRRVVIATYGLVALVCAFSLVVAASRKSGLGLLLVLVEFAVILGIRRLGLDQEARRAADLGPTKVEKAPAK
jgi:UDP-GlcNAc:undecaprenyl-phosphate GlcNAc-1-phosphate transferase